MSHCLCKSGENFAPPLELSMYFRRKKEYVAVGGSAHPSAPRGSLFALELIAQRYSAEELCNIANRFPFKDR